MTHADWYFAIGSWHKTCQDYVRSGKTKEGFAYTIVSDGCSSSPDTDIGARLLVLAAEHYITNGIKIDFKAIALWASGFAANLRLPSTCLDATLLIAVESPAHILVYMMGDGVIANRCRNGLTEYIRTDYTGGAPFYPSYLIDPSRYQAFIDLPNNCGTYYIGEVGTAATGDSGAVANTDYLNPKIYHKSEVDLIVLMTDGAMSFRKGTDQVPVVDVVEQIMGVKNQTGEFMTRRVKKFLGSYCVANGWSHYDDFGIGAIFVDDVDK